MTSGRRRHSWDPELSVREPDGTLTSQCVNCGMIEKHGWFRAGDGKGRVYDVMQWISPRGVLLGIRPTVNFDAPKVAPDLAEAFPNAPVRGMPECPREHRAWSRVRKAAECP